MLTVMQTVTGPQNMQYMFVLKSISQWCLSRCMQICFQTRMAAWAQPASYGANITRCPKEKLLVVLAFILLYVANALLSLKIILIF